MRAASLAEPLDEADHGGKAAHLSRAVRAGLPVPDGFALPFDLVELITRGNDAAIEALKRACAPLAWPVAARSSALGEDSNATSFAGQHLTRLNVCSLPELQDAIVAIMESSHSPSALAYRRRLGITGEPRMGVVVQRLVVPDCAGVLFSRDPLTGAEEIVIEASWGLGEVVVGGLVVPDRYRLTRGGVVLERTAGVKDVVIRPLVQGGTAEMGVATELVCALCLTDGQLAELCTLARKCEDVFGGPQDLEWAFAAGSVSLLQQRALTGV